MDDDNSSDSLSSNNNKATEVEDEIMQAFANADDNLEASVCTAASRASVDSQKSISFFVDLKDNDDPMARSEIVTPMKRISSGRRTRSQQGERLTQSMYVRSDSQSSGVSFFVDLTGQHNGSHNNSNWLVHSTSREEADHDLNELSEDMRVKSSLLLEQNIEQTKAFFKKLKDYVDFLATPSYSKDELRQKRRMAESISRVMFEEEQKLKKGQGLSSIGDLDQVLLGQPRNNLRPVSALVGSSTARLNPEDRPVLRRERTFDLEPPKAKLVEVNIDDQQPKHDQDDPNDEMHVDEHTLQMFQQQRLYHTMRLKREVAKLEKIEKEISKKASEIGPESRPKTNTPRSCWAPEEPAKDTTEKTTFKNLQARPGSSQRSMFKLNMRASTAMSDSMESTGSNNSYSWFIPSEDVSPERPLPRPRPKSSYCSRSMGIQTGQSLMRQFQEKKDKACYVRDRPQAYFIECEGQQSSKQRPRSAFIESRQKNSHDDITTTIIDLETDPLPKEKDLQEALRRKRPDYIAKTKTREQDRLARSFVAANKKAVYAPNEPLKAKIKDSTNKTKAVYERIKTSEKVGKASVKTSENGSNVNENAIKAENGLAKSKIPTMRSQNGGSAGRSETVTLFSRPSSSRSRPASGRQGQKPLSAARPAVIKAVQ